MIGSNPQKTVAILSKPKRIEAKRSNPKCSGAIGSTGDGLGGEGTGPASEGLFIVFEGGDGTGKSTQAKALADRIGARLTFEPGDTPAGVKLRQILLDPDEPLDPKTEALLMAADRAQHVATVIRPTLAAGQDVVCDRYIGSSLAYQGFGRGLDVDDLEAVSLFAAGGLMPDLVICLVADDQEVHARRAERGISDRFEREASDFHGRVTSGFAALAEDGGWLQVDGVGTVDQVADRVIKALTQHVLSDLTLMERFVSRLSAA